MIHIPATAIIASVYIVGAMITTHSVLRVLVRISQDDVRLGLTLRNERVTSAMAWFIITAVIALGWPIVLPALAIKRLNALANSEYRK